MTHLLENFNSCVQMRIHYLWYFYPSDASNTDLLCSSASSIFVIRVVHSHVPMILCIYFHDNECCLLCIPLYVISKVWWFYSEGCEYLLTHSLKTLSGIFGMKRRRRSVEVTEEDISISTRIRWNSITLMMSDNGFSPYFNYVIVYLTPIREGGHQFFQME